MHDTPNPMGEPEAMDTRESNRLVNSVAALGFVLWGIFFANYVASTGVRGASRSAKLKWQQRQCEVDEAIAAQQSVDSSKLRSVADLPNTTMIEHYGTK